VRAVAYVIQGDLRADKSKLGAAGALARHEYLLGAEDTRHC